MNATVLPVPSQALSYLLQVANGDQLLVIASYGSSTMSQFPLLVKKKKKKNNNLVSSVFCGQSLNKQITITDIDKGKHVVLFLSTRTPRPHP